MKLFYLPGFNSNGQGNFFCETVGAEPMPLDVLSPNSLDPLIARIRDIQKVETVKLIGNSLGGWAALNISRVCNVPILLINPAVKISGMSMFIGTQTNFDTGIEYEFTSNHVDQLVETDFPFSSFPLNCDVVYAVLSKADEIIPFGLFDSLFSIEPSHRMELEGGHRLSDEEKVRVVNSKVWERFIG